MNIVVFTEGGIVQSVIDLDAPKPEEGIEYTVVDYDMFDGDTVEDIAGYWNAFSPKLRAYFVRQLPDEKEMFMNAIADVATRKVLDDPEIPGHCEPRL